MPTTYDGTTTTVAASSSPQTLTVANDMRGGLIISNSSTMTLYVLVGQGAVSTSVYSYAVPTQKSLEVPFTYVGAVSGIWPANVADGGANVTVLS
jgi:hypothetical protein